MTVITADHCTMHNSSSTIDDLSHRQMWIIIHHYQKSHRVQIIVQWITAQQFQYNRWFKSSADVNYHTSLSKVTQSHRKPRGLTGNLRLRRVNAIVDPLMTTCL